MFRQIILAAVFIFSSVTTFISCDSERSQQIKIAISKEKHENSTTKYADWLLRHNDQVVYYDLYPLGIDSALKLLQTCNGLLLTGGEDVFPGNYGKIDDTARCGTFDRYRDSLEFALIEKAISNKMPVFGVCRGEQILNVSQGGTLFIDIPTDYDTIVKHANPDWSRAYHSVKLVNNTSIADICGGTIEGDVVTNHHQGVENIGTGLCISAHSKDNFPEAIEWIDTADHAFLIAVQWHPEAMDTLHPLSAPLANKFLLEASNYKANN